MAQNKTERDKYGTKSSLRFTLDRITEKYQNKIINGFHYYRQKIHSGQTKVVDTGTTENGGTKNGT